MPAARAWLALRRGLTGLFPQRTIGYRERPSSCCRERSSADACARRLLGAAVTIATATAPPCADRANLLVPGSQCKASRERRLPVRACGISLSGAGENHRISTMTDE
jgi:hypothetical protein